MLFGLLIVFIFLYLFLFKGIRDEYFFVYVEWFIEILIICFIIDVWYFLVWFLIILKEGVYEWY